ncbi:MAG: hypothetical protein MUE53_02380 [Chitinophagales bacterium]|jgi:translation initiation factor IF-2|nr:hypothetical protein [Chitinophagales bacterium]
MIFKQKYRKYYILTIILLVLVNLIAIGFAMRTNRKQIKSEKQTYKLKDKLWEIRQKTKEFDVQSDELKSENELEILAIKAWADSMITLEEFNASQSEQIIATHKEIIQ